MRAEDFRASMPGELVPILGGHLAFVPSPLPPQIQWTPELVVANSNADRAVALLAGVGGDLENPHVMIHPFLRREAVLSSKIEGIVTTLSDLLLSEAEEHDEDPGQPRVDDADIDEVRNYVHALMTALETTKTMPLVLRVIRDIHRVLLEGVRGEDKAPGEFRKRQVHIGSRSNQPIEEARFVPPPPAEMELALNQLEAFINTPSPTPLPPLARLALIHYQFETIHPFLDGNGRLGRVILTVLLCREGILPQPLLYLSAYFEAHKQEYCDRLLYVSQRAEWVEWLAFFLKAVQVQAEDAVRRAKALNALRKEFHNRVKASTINVHRLIDHLFANPYMTVRRAEVALEMKRLGAQDNIARLVEAKILEKLEGAGRATKRGRPPNVYVAKEILAILEDEHAR